MSESLRIGDVVLVQMHSRYEPQKCLVSGLEKDGRIEVLDPSTHNYMSVPRENILSQTDERGLLIHKAQQALAELDDEGRLEVFSRWCRRCGRELKEPKRRCYYCRHV